MVTTDFNIPRVMAAFHGRIDKAMEVIGAQAVSWAADRLRANGYSEHTPPPPKGRTGNLNNSIAWSTDKKQSKPKTESSLPLAQEQLTTHIGSMAAYAARVEFGFVGKDSLGRVFNQKQKSYLRAGIYTKRRQIESIIQRALSA